MGQKAPGKAFRKGITLLEITGMFPDEASAVRWFEEIRWPGGRKHCPHCGSVKVSTITNGKPMPYRCCSCRKHFSVRTNTIMAQSKIPVRKWVIAIYLYATSLKGVASMKLYRDLGITQKSAWFMAHRIREAMADGGLFGLEGPVEVDETYIGGLEKNKHASKKLNAGRGGVGKAIVAGAKDRATNQISAAVVPENDKATLHGFIKDRVNDGAAVFTDEHGAYTNLPYEHGTVAHGRGEYVDGEVHTNGIESFWAMFKRAHKGTYHKMSPKHLQRYVDEFAARHGLRRQDTISIMREIVSRSIGRRLTYQELIGE